MVGGWELITKQVSPQAVCLLGTWCKAPDNQDLYCWQLAWGGCFYQHLVGQEAASLYQDGNTGRLLRRVLWGFSESHSTEGLPRNTLQSSHVDIGRKHTAGGAATFVSCCSAVGWNCSTLTSTWNSWAPGRSWSVNTAVTYE